MNTRWRNVKYYRTDDDDLKAQIEWWSDRYKEATDRVDAVQCWRAWQDLKLELEHRERYDNATAQKLE